MTNQRPPDPSGFTPEDEIDEVLGYGNPNPERVGCLPREVLVELAFRKRSIEDAGYHHIADCSPCFREFRAIQQARVRQATLGRLRRRWSFAAAAAAVLLAAAVWFLTVADRTGVDLIPAETQTAELRTEIDLQPYTVERSDRQRAELPPVPLARGRLSMTIRLPIGFEPGDYDLQVLDSELRSRATASARGEIREFVTTLDATMDLSSVPPGSYQLAIRREDEDWHLFPAVVK